MCVYVCVCVCMCVYVCVCIHTHARARTHTHTQLLQERDGHKEGRGFAQDDIDKLRAAIAAGGQGAAGTQILQSLDTDSQKSSLECLCIGNLLTQKGNLLTQILKSLLSSAFA